MRWLIGTTILWTTIASAATPFYAFENGVRVGSFEQQAALLKELGYDGIGSAGPKNIPERLKAYDAAGIKLVSLYVGAKIGDDGIWCDPAVEEAIRQLKGRDTIIELNVRGNSKDGDAKAAEVVGKVADLAKASGLRVVLYPHAGFYVDTVGDGVRVATLAKRDNVGVIFNLCHFLKVEPTADLEQTLTSAAPYLWMASTCGADANGKDWTTLIQTLDRGNFDQQKLLDLLKKVGFNGPIGIQCYNIKGDPKENLTRSIGAWKKLTAP